MENCGDVLVVGAGPVGALLALGLAQAGASVTIVEAAPRVWDAPRATVSLPSTLVILHELGVLADVEQRALEVRSFGVRVPEYGFSAVLPYPEIFGYPLDRQLHLGQDQLTTIVLEHARRLGVGVRFGHKVVSLAQDADGASVDVETQKGTERLRARWIVGADGARSTVRGLLGLQFQGMTWWNRYVATNVYCDFARHGYQPANFILDPVYAGVVAVIDRDNLWRVTYQEDAALPAQSFMERLPERYAHLIPPGEPYQLAAASPYAIHQRAAPTLRRGRVLLAGDAAHATNPSGGFGLTTGVWDAAVLADVLGAIVRGQADERMLDAYSAERLRIFWEVSSPNAVENKRMQEERDPRRREQDMAGIRAAAEDPEVSRLHVAFPFKVIGDTLRAGSRWTDADPTRRAGISLQGRKAQLS